MGWKTDRNTSLKIMEGVTGVKQETIKKWFQRKEYKLDDLDRIKEFILLRMKDGGYEDIENS